MAPAPQRWARVEEIFHQALEQPPDGRDRWLDAACADDGALRSEVASLLASDSAARGGFVGSEVHRAIRGLREQEASKVAMEGRQIGSYRLIREIGRGGMGNVYLAVRADEQYEAQVAIKLVRPGLDTDFILRRFRRERQILARLEHPNISRMFDGGTTEEGIPYLVMEYIDGVWITRYAAGRGLSLEDRLHLYMPVCAAVDYAHRNFIVHRDLKPGNILIDGSGSPKLLDFGISKLLHAEWPESGITDGVPMMTPAYASPEQILGEPITIASDVYSLGAVLYELLTGARPHRIENCAPLALQRAICLDPLPPPSAVAQDASLARRLKGDLDNIVLRAMQKQPERRYASVEHLAEDLRRYLEHRPVTARPDSLPYRAGKFMRRNLVAVTVAAFAAVAVLVGSAFSVGEARLADERFHDARKLANAFVFDVDEAARGIPGSKRVRQLIARTGLQYLNSLAAGSARDWALKRELASAYLHIGVAQSGNEAANLDDPAAALASFTSAGNLLGEVLRHIPSDRAAARDRMQALHRIAILQREMGQFKAAGEAARTGLEIAQPLLAANARDLDAAQAAGLFHLELASLSQLTGDSESAQSESASGAQLLRQVAEARPDNREAQLNLAASLGSLGSVLSFLAHREESLASYRSQVTALTALCDAVPSDTAARHELMLAYSHVGDQAGDAAGAYQAYGKMAAAAKILYDADAADIGAVSDYGIALLRLGPVTPSNGPAKREALELSHYLLTRAAVHNPQSSVIASRKSAVERELAVLSLGRGDRPSGIRYYRMAIATAEGQPGAPNDSSSQEGLVASVRGLAEEQARMGARADALATIERALDMGKAIDTAAPGSSLLRVNVARAWHAAGSVYAILSSREKGPLADQDRDSAREWCRRALDEWRRLESIEGFPAALRTETEATSKMSVALGVSR